MAGTLPGPSTGLGTAVYQDCNIQQLLDRYTFGELIGIGAYATVKKAVDNYTGQQVAIKIVDKARYRVGDVSLQREIEVLCMVDHPNCVQLYAVYYTLQNVYIVMELVSGGELLDRITERGNYTEQVAAALITQILQGVAYLHSHGIVHRDLKLENLILLNDREDSPVKIADFGLAKMMKPEEATLRTMCGSPQYVAPEILQVGTTVEEYTPAVDMWSVGVILFILLSGYSPFDDDNDAALFANIKEGRYDIDDPVWDVVSDSAKDLVAKLLTVDAGARLSARQALSHPWLRIIANPTGGPPLRSAQNGMRSGALRVLSNNGEEAMMD
jgi:calcium/calmodulin-dependent protein kinase I